MYEIMGWKKILLRHQDGYGISPNMFLCHVSSPKFSRWLHFTDQPSFGCFHSFLGISDVLQQFPKNVLVDVLYSNMQLHSPV